MIVDLTSGSTAERTELEREIKLPAGSQLEVRLREIPSTGYVWELSASPECVELQNQELRPLDVDRDPETVGGASAVCFQLKVSEGEGQLVFTLRRPWLEGEIHRRFILNLN